MNKKKRNPRKKKASSNVLDAPPTSSQLRFPPTLSKLAEEIIAAQHCFDRLLADNADLKNKLSDRSQQLGQAQQKITDLENECKSLKLKIDQAEEEIRCSEVNALVSFFADMADERNNRLLRKLLTFEEDKPKLLHDVAHYFRENAKIALEGDVGVNITLTNENIDLYEIQESVSLPCRVQVIGRGISYQGKSILRIQVELSDADTDGKENANRGN